jgi:hypothetical protein
VAKSETVSLVDVPESTVILLYDRTVESVSISCSTAGATAASVNTNPSIVAMSGAIIPEPFAIPTTVNVSSLIVATDEDPLANVSVVRIASAAASQPRASLGAKCSLSSAKSPTKRSSGSVSPMTPVEAR